MNFELAAIVALVAHGNAYLAGKADVTPPDLLQNPTSAYTESITFIWRDQPGSEPRIVARNTAEWLLDLKRRGAERLRLADLGVRRGTITGIQPHQLEAFSNGVMRGVQAEYPGANYEMWAGRWGIGDRNAPESKIWRVLFEGERIARPVVTAVASVPDANAALRKALHSAEEFARRANEPWWAEIFAGALEIEESGADPAKHLYGMLPEQGYSSDARRLLGAASAAWVFGGMGSWNDLGFADASLNEGYDRVSVELYRACLQAIEAAADSFQPA